MPDWKERVGFREAPVDRLEGATPEAVRRHLVAVRVQCFAANELEHADMADNVLRNYNELIRQLRAKERAL